ncbi:MAG: hypothetical protein ABEK29_02945, partial [Bradymonadaceae bacterium]
DRWSVEEDLEEMDVEGGGGDPEGDKREKRRNQTTEQVSSEEMQIPGDSESRPGKFARRSGGGFTRWAVIGGTATALVVAALAVIYSLSGGGW